MSDYYASAAPPAPRQAGEMSTTARNLWIVSILVVVALFVCCVVLVYSTELRFTSSAG